LTKVKGVRAVRVADEDLDPQIREVLDEMRASLGGFGWTVHAERRGNDLSFEFTNPLSSMASGIGFESNLTPTDLRRYLAERINEEPEFARTQVVDPPRRKRPLLGGLRYAAIWYGWPDRVFQEIADTLVGFRILSKEEGVWLKAIGPGALTEDLKSKLAKHRKAERRREKSARARRAR
jgi:hypothetical protein